MNYEVGFCQKKCMTWENALEFAIRHNFNHIELECDFIGKNEKLREDYIKTIAEKAQENNISLSVHCVNGINLAEKVYLIRCASVEIMKKSVELANKLGALWVTTHLGVAGTSNIDSYKKRIEYAAQSINEIMRYSENIKICVENLPKSNGETSKHYFGSELSELKFIKDQFLGKIAFTLDIGHLNIYNSKKDAADILETIVPYTMALHIHSNDGHNDQHYAFETGSMNEWILEEYGLELLNKYLLIECYSLKDIIATKKKIVNLIEEGQ